MNHQRNFTSLSLNKSIKNNLTMKKLKFYFFTYMNKSLRHFLMLIFATFLLLESAKADECFKLSTSIKFGDKKIGEIEVNEICKSNVNNFMNLPIYGIINDKGDGVNIGGKRYKSCNDGFGSEENSYEIAMSGIYNKNCKLLNVIKNNKIQKAKISYFNKFYINDLAQLPARIFLPLSFFTKEELKNSKNLEISKKTMQDLLDENLITLVKSNKIKNSKFILEFESSNSFYFIREVLRADFNNDGIEDIWLDIITGSRSGTFREYGDMIIVKKSYSEEISVFNEYDKCRDLNDAESYKCFRKIQNNQSNIN
jgi:hypothetical protein